MELALHRVRFFYDSVFKVADVLIYLQAVILGDDLVEGQSSVTNAWHKLHKNLAFEVDSPEC